MSVRWHGPVKAKKPPAGIEGITYVLGDFLGNGTGQRRRHKPTLADLKSRRSLCQANLKRAREINPEVQPSWYLRALNEAVEARAGEMSKPKAKRRPAPHVSARENLAREYARKTNDGHIPFTEAVAFRMSGAELRELASSSNGVSEIAKREIARRKAKRAQKVAP